VYLVPFVEDEQTVFLKTMIIAGRKATKQYLYEGSAFQRLGREESRATETTK
jgi:hypothetical protein